MASILIAPAYFYRLDPKQWKDGRPYPPLGTLQAAAILRQRGHIVNLVDTCLAPSPEVFHKRLELLRPDIVVIYDDGFNYLTKMCLTVMREAAFTMIGWAHGAGCQVIVNSSDATDHYADYLAAGADAVALGEGDMTVADVVDRWSDTATIHDVQGIAYATVNGPVTTPKRPVLKDLDALPVPAWDLIDLAPYRRMWQEGHGFFSLNMATTRGCPFKCNWCAKPIYGNRYNSRSPEHVVDELMLLHKQHAPDHIWFADDIFGLRPGWVQRFRDVLTERGLRIRYKIQSRVDLLLESDTIDALVASGLEEVWVGAESGSQRILDAMDKGTRVEQIAEATRLLRSKGVRVGFFLQFGYIGETEADVERTIRMVEELQPDDIGVSVSYPLPGTKFHELVKQDLHDKANWTDSDDLAMMFRNAHRPAYYKRLHRYVHKRYRRQQAIQTLRGAIPFELRRALSALYYIPATTLERMRLDRAARA
jgi:anaerobic magnesium-protoporphyrin IX monomethyl ester cyclase